MATRSSTHALVVVTFPGLASAAFAILTLTSAPVIFGTSLETGSALHLTTFSGCDNFPRILSSVKLVSMKMLTASLSTIRNVAFVEKSTMHTYKSILPMSSFESLEAERRRSFLQHVD